MISVKVNLTLVGVFVLTVGATLIGALALLAGRAGPVDEYHIELFNVAGLKYGSQVLYEGYPIGQVESIEPLRDGERLRFRVEISVISGWNVPEDSVARSEASGLLAPQTITISAGRSKSLLKPGSLVPSGEAGGLFSGIASVVGNMDQLTETGLLPLMDNLNRQVTLLGEVVEKDLRPMVVDAQRIVASTAEHWPGIMSNAHRISSDLDLLIDKDRVEVLDRVMGNLDRAAQDLQQTTAALQSLTTAGGADLKAGTQEFRFVMESLSRNAESFSQNLSSTSLNLQDFSRQIRQNPGILLRAPEPQADPIPPLRDTRP